MPAPSRRWGRVKKYIHIADLVSFLAATPKSLTSLFASLLRPFPLFYSFFLSFFSLLFFFSPSLPLFLFLFFFSRFLTFPCQKRRENLRCGFKEEITVEPRALIRAPSRFGFSNQMRNRAQSARENCEKYVGIIAQLASSTLSSISAQSIRGDWLSVTCLISLSRVTFDSLHRPVSGAASIRNALHRPLR